MVTKTWYKFENDIKKALEARGWTVVRAAGSLGCVDLVVLNRPHAVTIQCKHTSKRMRIKRLAKETRAQLTKVSLQRRDICALVFGHESGSEVIK